jgi:hypothetical protein
VNQARYGHRVGDDGGCFASALASVRQWGGVLEHPALTLAWAGAWARLASLGWGVGAQSVRRVDGAC